MGVNNKQRRAAKKKRARNGSGPRARTNSPGPAPDLFLAQRNLQAAAECALYLNEEEREEHVLFLADASPGWQAVVSEALVREFAGRLGGLWRSGWQPADLFRVTRRQLKPSAEPMLATMLAFDARSYRGLGMADAEWLAQLDECEATEWWSPQRPLTGQMADRLNRCVRDLLDEAAGLLALFHRLPELPVLRTPPHLWATKRATRSSPRPPTAEPVDPKLTARLRALLSKAESTEFAEEAEALTAKAQQLMTRHSIDRSMLSDGDDQAGILGRRVGVDDPYAAQKASLLQEIATANRCHAVWSRDLGFSTLFGATGDLAGVEVLYLSLLVQATKAMLDAGSHSDSRGRSRTRSFRASFLSGFAARIGLRLREAAGQATDDAAETYGPGLLPALRSHDEAVTAVRDRLMPGIQQVSPGSVHHPAGWQAGQAAAEVADLAVGEQLTGRTA